MALAAFAGARPAAVHRYLPPAARLLLLLWARDGTDERTDTVPLHGIDPAPHGQRHEPSQRSIILTHDQLQQRQSK